MVKYLLLSLATILLISCSTKDELYYRFNPQELQSALKQCPTQPPANVSCQQLKMIATDVNELAYSLQSNPQAFGNKIITLQTELAAKKSDLRQNPDKSELNKSIASLQQELAFRLAIVKWLESPES